jgi:ATP-binding cassette subfamily C protein CydD
MGSMIDKELLALPGAKGRLALMLACAAVDAVAAIAQALTLASALAGLWYGASAAAEFGWLAGFFGAYCLRQVLAQVRSRAIGKYAEDRCAEMRAGLLGEVLEAGGASVSAYGTGTVVTTLLEGIDQVRTYISLMVPKIADLMVIPLLIAIALCGIDWVSGLIALCVLPFTFYFMMLIGSQAKERAERQHAEYDALSSHFVDSLRGIDTLALFGQAHEHGKRVYAVSERFRKATVATLRMATVSSLVLDLFATFGLAAIAIMLGFRLMGGSIALQPALTALILVPEYFAPVRRFASDFHASLDGKTALARVTEMSKRLHEAGVEVRAEEGASECSSEETDNARELHVADRTEEHRGLHVAGNAAEDEAGIAQWGPDDVLQLHGVSLVRSGGQQSAAEQEGASEHAGEGESERANGQEGAEATGGIRDVDLTLSGTQRIAVVGRSGAGKSTLLDVLAGFVRPTSGSFVITQDGRHGGAGAIGSAADAGGADPTGAERRFELASLRRGDWLSQVAYIPQDPHLFSMSLRDNVRFYRPDASDSDVREAVSAVGLDELAAELPEGIDTTIGEGARQLSGGQAQRISLARALVADRRILLLDEPTAHLDIETELALKERMLPLMEGRLVVLATHRLHWVRDMDLVVVLENGRVAQTGAPGELLADETGAYARLARALRGGERR